MDDCLHDTAEHVQGGPRVLIRTSILLHDHSGHRGWRPTLGVMDHGPDRWPSMRLGAMTTVAALRVSRSMAQAQAPAGRLSAASGALAGPPSRQSKPACWARAAARAASGRLRFSGGLSLGAAHRVGPGPGPLSARAHTRRTGGGPSGGRPISDARGPLGASVGPGGLLSAWPGAGSPGNQLLRPLPPGQRRLA